MYYFIEPEVAGRLGDSTVIDVSVHPPVVSHLEYKFEGWLGDDILESFPCFIVSSRLAEKLISDKFTGYELGPVTVSVAEEVSEIFSQALLPRFFWLKIVGGAGFDDFGIANDFRLVVSRRVKDMAEYFDFKYADFELYV
ncbi:hypothetical protein [Pseudomonas eucalypticola]|uniref:Uncharacterized protein n=1 Tax=Pseudomonas eucalypticola TaxID=2599595 RepID=A0A7D5D3Z8_9PSED|nr:hypothetical protein [Pseudomonas eucalypticola]QKZ02414.1 hypothetical protein HWQ56_00850 [Pseudomonas eucalypticola]